MDMLAELTRRHYDSYHSGIPWVDEETITFPLYAFNGKLVGYQQYRPDGDKTVRKNPRAGKYFSHVQKGYSAIWGIESLELKANFVVLCEGIFKACRFHRFGIPALAVLGKNIEHLVPQLSLLSLTKTVVGVPDPDAAGMELLDSLTYYIIPDAPVDDLTEEELELFVSELFLHFGS